MCFCVCVISDAFPYVCCRCVVSMCFPPVFSDIIVICVFICCCPKRCSYGVFICGFPMWLADVFVSMCAFPILVSYMCRHMCFVAYIVFLCCFPIMLSYAFPMCFPMLFVYGVSYVFFRCVFICDVSCGLSICAVSMRCYTWVFDVCSNFVSYVLSYVFSDAVFLCVFPICLSYVGFLCCVHMLC